MFFQFNTDSEQKATKYQTTQRKRKRTYKCISETESDVQTTNDQVGTSKRKSANIIKVQKDKQRNTQNAFYLNNLQVILFQTYI